MDLSITNHALLRYLEHHPEAGRDDLSLAVHTGVPIEEGIAQALTGRHGGRHSGESGYVLAPDRRGLFVTVTQPGRRLVVTYLRFGVEQERFARANWPEPPRPSGPVSSFEARVGDVGLVVIDPAMKARFGSPHRAREALRTAVHVWSRPTGEARHAFDVVAPDGGSVRVHIVYAGDRPVAIPC